MQNEEPAVEAQPVQPASHEFWGPIEKLAAALSKAQSEFTAVLKTSQNPFFKRADGTGGKYADLSAIIDATRPALAKHGLSVVQLPSCDGKMVTVTTILLHESGAGMKSALSVPGDKQNKLDVQTIGSAITYARRFSYQGMVHVAGEDDDDGNAASGKRNQKPDDEAGELHGSPQDDGEYIRLPGMIVEERDSGQNILYKLETLDNQGHKATVLIFSPKESDSGRLADRVGHLVELRVKQRGGPRSGAFTLMDVLQVRKPAESSSTGVGGQATQEPTKATPPATISPKKQTAPKSPPDAKEGHSWLVTDPQRKRLFALAKECGFDDAQLRNLAGKSGVEHLHEMTPKQYKEITEEMELYIRGPEAGVSEGA